MGQLSEFSILIVFLAIASGLIGNLAANFLLVATVLTFAVSSYLIVFQYPTPVAVSDKFTARLIGSVLDGGRVVANL